MVEWQRKNEASICRTAKEFAVDLKHVCEWCQCYSTLKGKTWGVLGNIYTMANLCQSILTKRYSSFRRMREVKADQSVIIFLCQHLGLVGGGIYAGHYDMWPDLRKETLTRIFREFSIFLRFSNCHISTAIYGSDTILGTIQVITFNRCHPTLEV